MPGGGVPGGGVEMDESAAGQRLLPAGESEFTVDNLTLESLR